MKLRVSRVHYPVTVLGPGRRAGIWVQGCTLACKGCISPDTWAADDRGLVEIDLLIDWISAIGADVDGVTISGGEPFQQPAALAELLRRLDLWRRPLEREIDLLCYSGYGIAWLRRRHSETLARLDAIIPGRFLEGQPTDLVWRGSANQQLIPLSALGHRKMADHVDRVRDRPEMQVSVDGDTLYLIGIPGRGDIERFEAALRERGVAIGGPG